MSGNESAARALVEALDGRWLGSYGMARCPVHDDRTPSLSVRDTKDAKVLVFCHAGCSQAAVVDALSRLRLWASEPAARRDVGHVPRPKLKPDQATDPSNITRALELWHASRPAMGTDAEVYLRSRGIALPIPPTLRFHANLRHGPTGLSLPAMVAAVQGPDGRISGVHRTFLKPGGHGKADVDCPRMALGRCREGAVRLAVADSKLAVGEGIETSLAVMQATGIPAWAGLSTSGMKAVVLPSSVREVILLADGDTAGEKAAAEAARRFDTKGRTIRIARPPRGFDFNDLLQRPSSGTSPEGPSGEPR